MRVLAALIVLSLTVGAAMAQTFKPKPIDDLLANPDVGWQTFGVAAKQDRNLPEWIPSTVMYMRLGWDDVEPAHGDYSFADLEKHIDAAQDSGQTLAFRVMCNSTNAKNPYHPQWLKDIGGRVVSTEYSGKMYEVPDLDDPKTLEAHLKLIVELGKKYDGDPRISHVDLGSAGWWGEWHMSGSKPVGMPSEKTRDRIIDVYMNSFRRTPVLMLIGGDAQLKDACARGAGWRADCLGDLGGFSPKWNHMHRIYPEAFATSRLKDAWKRAPVAWESCWDMRKWTQEGWPLRYIFNYALATHGSFLNNKSAPLPEGEDVRPEIERFLRRLGYRFVLREVTVTFDNGEAKIASRWQNVGSAPIYRPATVQLQLRAVEGDAPPIRFASTLETRELMPGHVEPFTDEFLKSPPDLPDGPIVNATDHTSGAIAPGEYELRVAMTLEDGRMIRLANEGRDDDGWYTLGKIAAPR